MNTLALAPHGASKGPSRDEAEGIGRKYVYRPYPAARYHPDGRTREVRDAAEDAALGEAWSAKQFPPPPIFVVPPEPTVQEMKASVFALTHKVHELNGEIERLTKELDDLKSCSAEQLLEVTALRKELDSAQNVTRPVLNGDIPADANAGNRNNRRR